MTALRRRRRVGAALATEFSRARISAATVWSPLA